ncbi:MAG: transglycosylase SLT domain-containing protein [Rickettsiella sp.]|nr:transglycosylase SLT domain-containing protein [Rickettsiella sp.]
MDLVTLVLACSLYTDNSIPYAMIETGSKNNPLVVTIDNGTKHFKTISEAVTFTKKQIAQGKLLDIGLMQIPNQWLPKVGAHAEDLFRPCKNLVVATQIMNKIRLQCQTIAERNPTLNLQTCMLSMYKTGNTQTGLDYAHTVINYAEKHPFSSLANKARDPGMLEATNSKKDLPTNANKTLITDTESINSEQTSRVS